VGISWSQWVEGGWWVVGHLVEGLYMYLFCPGNAVVLSDTNGGLIGYDRNYNGQWLKKMRHDMTGGKGLRT